MTTTISTIYRASVDVPNHLYTEYGDTQEFSTKSAVFSGAASVASSGENAYGDVEEWAEDSDRHCVERWARMWEEYIAELEVRIVPGGATHYADTYGKREFYRRRLVPHLNQASEKWVNLVKWDYWVGDEWEDVGAGFSDRRMKEIGK